MSDPDEITNIRLHPQVTRTVSLPIPVNTLELIQRVAANRDMTPEALLKFYIGQGLRQDAARLYSERILETTAEVLARHIPSEEERFAILNEIQGEAAD
jgi:transcriptional regulator of met regulon